MKGDGGMRGTVYVCACASSCVRAPCVHVFGNMP